MNNKLTAIERAFVIAKSGHAESVADILAAIKREGYPAGSLEGPSLQKQLRTLIKEARGQDAAVSRR